MMDFEVGKSTSNFFQWLSLDDLTGQTGPTKYRTWIVMTNLFDSCQEIKPTEGDEVYMATGHVDGNQGIC